MVALRAKLSLNFRDCKSFRHLIVGFFIRMYHKKTLLNKCIWCLFRFKYGLLTIVKLIVLEMRFSSKLAPLQLKKQRFENTQQDRTIFFSYLLKGNKRRQKPNIPHLYPFLENSDGQCILELFDRETNLEKKHSVWKAQ
jgi:hypothetical protein